MKRIGSLDGQRISSIASLPRTEIVALMWGGLFHSGLGRISSISIMHAKLTRERCIQEILVQTPHVMWVWMQPRSARMRLMMKCLIKKQCETVRLWILHLSLIVKKRGIYDYCMCTLLYEPYFLSCWRCGITCWLPLLEQDIPKFMIKNVSMFDKFATQFDYLFQKQQTFRP